MTPQLAAQYWGFGVLLGFGMRVLFGLLRGLMQTPSYVIGRE